MVTPGKILFDFEAGCQSSGWVEINDGVMGGVSSSDFSLLPGLGAVFSGDVSLDNGGGFASVRSPPVDQDLSGFVSFALRVRGDGRRFKFNARTDSRLDPPVYQHAFETTRGAWQEHRLGFAQFIPSFRGRVLSNAPRMNPARIASLGFLIAGQQSGPFRLEIAWIKASGSADDC